MSFSRAPSNTGVADRHAATEILAKFSEALVVERLDRLVLAVDLLQLAAQRLHVVRAQIGVHGFAHLPAKTGAGPAEMGLEDLADIHAARHAERIEHDVDRRAVGEERHVLLRHDARHDALVAMASRHLVAGLDLALHRDEDLGHLHHAGRQLVAALELLDLVEEAAFQRLLRIRRIACASPRSPTSSGRTRARSSTIASAAAPRAASCSAPDPS